MLRPPLNSRARSRCRCPFADAGQALPPAVGDRQTPIPAERLQRDLRSRCRLPALELGDVHQPEDLGHHLRVVAALEQLGHPQVAVDVVGDHRVELLVGGERVAVLLPGGELRRRRLVDRVLRDRLGLAPVAGVPVAPAGQLPDQRLGHVLDRREATGRVAVERGVPDRHLALVAGRQQQVPVLVGQPHQQRAADAGLQVLRGDPAELDGLLEPLDDRRDRDDGVVQAQPLRGVLGVGQRVLAGPLRRQADAVHAVGAQGVDGDAATSPESIPPDRPRITEGMPFLSMKSLNPRTSARQTSSQSLSGSATVPGRASNAATGSSESTCRVTVIGPSRPSRRSPTAARSTVRSTHSRCSTNCGARAISSPPAATTIESPSKTSSSWPPTWLQYAIGARASAARRRTSGSRTSSLARSYGEALGETTRSTPACPATPQGPPSTQRSSQTVSATSTPCNRNTGSSVPGTK